MSFGFSVGDFVIVGKLIAKIVEALRGSRSQYQELIRELERYEILSPFLADTRVIEQWMGIPPRKWPKSAEIVQMITSGLYKPTGLYVRLARADLDVV